MSEQSASYFERMKLIKLGLLPREAVAKEKKPLKKVSDKKAAEMKEQKIIAKETGSGETELQKWYSEIMAKETPRCWETGEWINVKDTFGWHGSVAHVLPKELFPSVKVHPQNYMILKMWGGTHGDYDASWEKAAKMNVWPYAVKVFNILYPLLTTEEKAKLPDIVLQEIKPEIYNAKLEPQ